MTRAFAFRPSFAAFAFLSTATLLGCGAAPEPRSGEPDDTFGIDEAALSNQVVELVPADDKVRVACRTEINRMQCGDAEANKAVAACQAKVPVRHACKLDKTACFKREFKNLSCARTSESYATLSACAAPLSRNCAFYAQCLDKAVVCGESGYALGFGEKYCNGFRRTTFSAAGTAWVNSVMICLQRALVPTVQSSTRGYVNASLAPASSQVCTTTLDTAFASHPGCYTKPEASICFLGPVDIAKIFGVIGASEVFTVRTASQISSTIGTCVGQIARRLVGVSLSAPGTNPPSAADDRLVRASLRNLRRTEETEQLLEQRQLWLDYAKQYGVEVE
jgi:hypothetical protein